VSDKSKKIGDLLARIPAPSVPLPADGGRSLLEVGFLSVLQRYLSESAAERTLAALAAAYPDWNELRVSQAQEFQHLIQSKSPEQQVKVAWAVREYLQEIFQKVHGFNLEPLRGDLAEAARFASQLPFLGASTGHYLLHLACPDGLPISPPIVRALDRLGLAKRTSSIKKAQAGFEGYVPPELRREFAVKFGLVVEKWCDARKPVCWECPLVEVCPFGKKTLREWKAQQRRLELQRARDEERARKEADKQRKRAAAEHKRRLIAQAKESARRARLAERAARAAERTKQKLAAQAARKKVEAARARKKSAPKKTIHKTVQKKAARTGRAKKRR
jgi:endonuclease III